MYNTYSCVEISKILNINLNKIYSLRQKLGITQKQNPQFVLNDLQKQYIRHIKDFIKDNIDKLWIYEINKIDEEIIIVEHNIMDVLVNFDDILNDKLGVGKILINK